MHQLVVWCKTRISGYANRRSKIIGANSKNPECAGANYKRKIRALFKE